MAKIIIKDGQLSSSAGINVPGSFSVSGNMVIGDSFTDTLIINSTTTFNDDLAVLDTISGSVGKFGTISGSVISASQYIGPITASPAGTSGQIQFNSNSVLSADSNFVWDNTNKRLGIGTAAPVTPLNVAGEIRGNNLSDNFAGSFNVNLGNGNIEGRGLVAGYSGGSYGGIGYNIRHTTTGGTYISPLADTTNYIQFSQGFQFLGDAGTTAGRTTNFAELMRITNAGRVGIGTTSPSARLEIQGGSAAWNETTPGQSVGTIHLDPGNTTNDFGNAITFGASDNPASPNEGTNAQAGIYIRSDGTYGTKMYFATTNDFAAGSKTRMMIDQAGNTGIGTTSPLQALDVVGSMRLSTGNIFRPDNAGVALILGNGTNTHYGTHLFFNAAGSSERVRITDAGNVGIGTNNPNTSLSVKGAGTGIVDIGQWAGSSNYGAIYLNGDTSTNNYNILSAGTDKELYLNRPTGQAIRFRMNNADQMVLENNGRLGIGTTSPATRLHIANDSGLTIETVGAVWANIGANVATANYMQLRRPGSANALGYIGGGGGGAISAGTSNDLAIRSEGDLHLATGNSPRVTITSAGNVGIGTSNPNFTLAVTGTLGVSGNTTIANGNLIIGTGGKGIDFSAATNAAGMTNEIFDDYEVGTWTPALAVGTSTFNYDSRSGRYVKIGNLVYASFTIDTGTGTSINVNSVSSITGLPFTSVSNNRSSCQIHWSGLATSVFNVFGVVEGSQTSIYLYVSTAATAGSSDMSSVYFDGSMILQGSVVYQVS